MSIIVNNALLKVEEQDINEDGSFTTPVSVTSIGDRAFIGCKSLTTVSIRDSVTLIGDWAFSHCESLTTVTIPGSVIPIGKGAFFDCESLITVTILHLVTSIGEGAFYNCESLITVNIPDSLTSIGARAFFDCVSLTTVNIPHLVISIGEEAFFGCESLTTITIPDSVTSIGERAFFDCKSLTTVTITDSLRSIGENAFVKCNITTLIIDAKTDEGFEQMKNRLPQELQSKVTSKEIYDFAIKTKQNKLEQLLRKKAINPLVAVSKELPDYIKALVEDNWYEINKNMADDIPCYQEARAEIEKLPLPENNQAFAFKKYEDQCTKIINEWFEKAKSVKGNLPSTKGDTGDEIKPAASKAGLFSHSSTDSSSETENKEPSPPGFPICVQ